MPETENRKDPISNSDLKRELDELRKAVEELKGGVADLLVAWTTSKGILAALKWLSYMVLPIIAIVAYLKGK